MSVDLPSILHLSGLLHPCLGFNKTSHHFKVLRHPNEEQSVIEIDVNGDARLISKACEVITKKENGFCKSCYLAKEGLCKRKAELKNIRFTKNSVLSKQELCLKLDMVTREKRNAVRREEYWKVKFQEECMEVDREDHQDFTAMLNEINPEKVNDDMRLLLQQQEKALRTQSKTGPRWHPK